MTLEKWLHSHNIPNNVLKDTQLLTYLKDKDVRFAHARLCAILVGGNMMKQYRSITNPMPIVQFYDLLKNHH